MGQSRPQDKGQFCVSYNLESGLASPPVTTCSCYSHWRFSSQPKVYATQYFVFEQHMYCVSDLSYPLPVIGQLELM